jgi:hypothetical protein
MQGGVIKNVRLLNAQLTVTANPMVSAQLKVVRVNQAGRVIHVVKEVAHCNAVRLEHALMVNVNAMTTILENIAKIVNA